MATKTELFRLAKLLGFEAPAKKIITRDKANTKAGKKAAPKRKR